MYKIGVDLGGTNIACGIVDQSGKLIYKDSSKTPRGVEPIVIINEIAEICKKTIKVNQLDNTKISSIGIGIPGIVNNKTGIVKYAPNIDFKNVDLRSIFSKLIDIPVNMENDANAAALGESLQTHLSDYENVVFVTLGTGIGVGVIIEKNLLKGSIESGHITIDPSGPLCGCGNRGCFESFCSATALINFAKESVENNKDTKILELVQDDVNRIEAKTIFDAFDMRDTLSSKILERYIKYLAIGINNLINSYPTDAVIIGGGISKQGDNLIKPLTLELEKIALGGVLSAKIFTAKLGNDAGIVGAANL